MIVRRIQKELVELAREYKVITITGPRQSGKTTLARMQFPDYDYVNMENPEIRQLAEQDAREFLKRHPAPLIIDEIQRLPMLLSYIQVKCDQSRQKGQYILTGSHQPKLKAEITQSLAGRTAILQLYPLSLEELAEAVGVTRQTIISLENGKYNASLILAHRIARYFGLTIEEVFLFEEESE